MSDHDFDTRLRSALRAKAEGLPYAGDLAGDAIGRARSIRRRAVSATAVLAVVVVAVPLGLARIAGDTSAEPPVAEPVGTARVALDLDALPEGARPSVPYADNGVFFLANGAGTADFQSLNYYGADAWGEYVAVTELGGAGDKPRLNLFDNSGQQSQTVLVEAGADSTAASTDHRWLAFVDGGEGGASGTITVALEAGFDSKNTFRLEGRSAELLSVVDGTVYFRQGGGHPSLQSWSSADKLRSYPYTASMVSDDGSLVGTFTERGDFTYCYGLAELASDDVRWQSCDWAPTSVSPDGQWIYATPAYADGYGPTRVAVLDAETGELVRQVRPDVTNEHLGVVRDAEWESADSLLLNVESGGNTALVRLDVLTGEVELATDAVPYAGIDDPDPPPYLLG
ncbi:MAG: hypothetical protein M3Q87_02215 [Actinomycetota bacterium]|nr:hypothetical protein [Actinomycetota bacterium]